VQDRACVQGEVCRDVRACTQGGDVQRCEGMRVVERGVEVHIDAKVCA
jgi:hypothetical protein